eukprot:975580-Rhodomonas_salina.1
MRASRTVSTRATSGFGAACERSSCARRGEVKDSKVMTVQMYPFRHEEEEEEAEGGHYGMEEKQRQRRRGECATARGWRVVFLTESGNRPKGEEWGSGEKALDSRTFAPLTSKEDFRQ